MAVPEVAVIWVAVAETRMTGMAVIGVAETGMTREMVDSDSDSAELDDNGRDDVRVTPL